MSNPATIANDRFPRQSKFHPPGTRVYVLFPGDMAHKLRGIIVRNDIEAPYRLIIRLDDGRYVLADECAYSEHPPRSRQEQP